MINSFKRFALFIAAGLFSLNLVAQKKDVPQGWHLLDSKDSGYYGISMDKAYAFVKAKKLKSEPVIVAVIDSGIDTLHEDLKSVLWVNTKEIPGNGIDDDNNGYVDDVHGWNFLGGKNNTNVDKDSYEAARVYHKYKAKFEGKSASSFTGAEAKEYEMWAMAKEEVAGEMDAFSVMMLNRMYKTLLDGDSVIKKELGKEEYTCKDLATYTTTNAAALKAKGQLLSLCKMNETDEISNVAILNQLSGEVEKLKAVDTPPTNYRGNVVNDNYNDINDRFYGNNNLMVSNSAAMHGTHVSGIIAAARNNGVGMDGVADNVKIMTVRAVPDGDEHDKDIALAIRYAVDNGARIINMSFGKSYSPEKKWVDEAVQYAQSKGVLLVHAAGNSAKNLDTTFNFPTPVYENGQRASNWITVGASGPSLSIKEGGLTANFSNYGKKEVDVFAPGVKIYATVPGGNTYANLQGTSMASPVVAGLAAFILNYYPKLTAEQVKYAIEKSVTVPNGKVLDPGTKEEVDFSELSRNGGIVNAYEAIKIASTLKGERKETKAPVKSSVKPKAKD